MKRIIVLSIVILSVIIILVGKYRWDDKVEVTIQAAEEKIQSPLYKEKLPHLQKPTKETQTEETETESVQPVKPQNNNSQTSENHTEEPKPNTTEQEVETTAKPEIAKYSLEEIREAYYKIFSQLEIQEGSRIDQLIVEAKAEFVSSNEPLESLINKYEAIAREMEKNADAAFQYVYEQMQFDLERNGYDKDALAEFIDIYETKKQERLQRVIEQLEDF